MLSEKKSMIGQKEIDFLGMKISHGTICPGPHLAEQLSQFPDDNLSVKEIQKFLGIINYIRDFIPHANKDNKRSYCGHASGEFKDSQKHYHTVFKEIIAVKNGIQKFDFYVRSKYLTVEMDNSSFPNMLEFQNKILPNPQILRWKAGFPDMSSP
ncbi:uncharacterized protein LOC131161794 [Malania oleifera]|uniref:uncharacterized protein LOC131161794 n=1 Tax=Malania oleifera TaxID=397392 RepID=UPI0025ADDAA6|nr:uncharacterized protein LOC131161794 [Malania oleifera]